MLVDYDNDGLDILQHDEIIIINGMKTNQIKVGELVEWKRL